MLEINKKNIRAFQLQVAIFKQVNCYHVEGHIRVKF